MAEQRRGGGTVAQRRPARPDAATILADVARTFAVSAPRISQIQAAIEQAPPDPHLATLASRYKLKF